MLIVAAPAFGGTYAPAQVKIGLTVLLAHRARCRVAGAADRSAMRARRRRRCAKSAIGLALALAIRALVAGAEFAGHLAGFQMGLSYGAIVDPQSGVRNNVLATLYGNMRDGHVPR